jgi:hypothetical protein
MKIDRITRSAPSTCFSGGHTVQHRVVSDDRQWMPTWLWAVIGLLGAALIIGAMPLPDDGRMPLRVTALVGKPEPASRLGPSGDHRLSQKENAQ